MTPHERNRLRRLRVLQQLQLGDGRGMAGPLVLRLLQDDPDLQPTLEKVQRSLVWLEDRGLADAWVYDIDEGSTMTGRITAAGLRYLSGTERMDGIAHPGDWMRERNHG